MLARAWLNTDDQFVPGTELFRSDRYFSVWAYTVSHGQLLLRTSTATRGEGDQSRIDVLFKPVRVTKLQHAYHGLVIRCATQEEASWIHAENSGIDQRSRCLILESAGIRDYIVTLAVGWEEDMETARDPSRLAHFAPGSDLSRILK
ncbi:hypothetical protein Ssi03_47750 [Sphaerisporangium siamense]|uniref:Uncharacterized protein n=1 Tax=Sphaerisporangium siamense TaxID=795645 RepID=A0A7W7D2J8_9ACTN|nr:hypothetical protein [Sphaerisporangium siamense]MBB4699088.1 hypothetical protein [Sphaerisporangium siamense]GII86785.1 hypothetical protein Ssi03_47750 [Sphaerisporangium siamense]